MRLSPDGVDDSGSSPAAGMRCGLFWLPVLAPGEAPGKLYEQLLELATFADQKGFASIWLAEHHFDAYGGIVPSPAVLAAVLAQRTTRLRIGIGVAVAPFYHPIRLAEEFAMVDILSNGRLDMGMGRGFMPHEMRGFGVTGETRQQRFIDAVVTVHRAWSTGRIDVGAAEEASTSMELFPRPLQRPYPPIWLAASTSPESFAFAGRHGFNLMINPYNRTDEEVERGIATYRDALSVSGLDVSSCRILAHEPLYVADSMRKARSECRAAFFEYLNAADNAFARDAAGQRVSTSNRELILSERTAVGDPPAIIKRLRAWRRRGVTDMCFSAAFRGLPPERSNASLRLFAKEVMPYV